jgi:hypothetical protein
MSRAAPPGNGVLVVASLGLTTPDATVRLRNQLRAAYAGVIGVVLYEDVSTGTGTGGYRIALVQQISESWALLVAGVSARTLRLGVNEDLGLSNTFVVVGFVGGALQIAALLLALVRRLRARSLAGATIAPDFLTLLVTRASLR